MAKLNQGNPRSDVTPTIKRGTVVVGRTPMFQKQKNGVKPNVITVKKQIQVPEVLSVSDVKRINKEAGQFFFEPESMRFFESKIETRGLLIKNKFFITSEQFIPSTGKPFPRKFTIRGFNRETGGIPTISKFQQFKTKSEAVKFAEKLK